jgi:hypothetical protein
MRKTAFQSAQKTGLWTLPDPTNNSSVRLLRRDRRVVAADQLCLPGFSTNVKDGA